MNEKKSVFETLLEAHKNALERFVYYKMNCKQDGEDVLQEVYLSAYKRFEQLEDQSKFKAWVLTIAANKCKDFYRVRSKVLELPLEEVTSYEMRQTRAGRSIEEVVSETLEELADKDKEILFLYYMRNEKQNEIAKRLNIPIGTVKSRLYKAKQQFKDKYPYPPKLKGEEKMIKFPKVMPEVSIVFKGDVPFEVICEEGFGGFIIPREHEKCSVAFYDYPEKTMTIQRESKVTRKAMISGIECVEIESKEYNSGGEMGYECAEYIRLTEDAVQYVAEWHIENGVKKFATFLEENFLEHFGWGADNYGFPIQLKQDAHLKLVDGEIICDQKEALGVIGRYDVTIQDKTYDTVRYVLFEGDLIAEKYIDQKGRTVLWRCYNKDDWQIERYGSKWSERLPQNIQIKVNGENYVHWYDCITDYIL
ncbi:MAG: RNA polymerase sigma factor [Niameybacter sp.]|nr:RNA polymerase sigma factor [Niameybacter sp.]